MLGWLYRVLIGRFGCEHKWEDHGRVQEYAPGVVLPVVTKIILRCTKCGEITSRKVF